MPRQEHRTGPRIVAALDGSPSSIEGIPAQVLLDASDGADLLVVGSRGHGGFTGALLGSVSQHCVHHAHCPVVVIRAQEHDRQDPQP